MTVAYERTDYANMLVKWQRCNDVCDGQDAVHAAGSAYLPHLKDQSEPEYEAYRDRTPFYNASWRTIVGLQGMLFRKPPKVIVPPTVEPMLDNIDLSGNSLHIFSLEVAEECLKLGRVGIFVDYPDGTQAPTLADAQMQNMRPSMRMYRAPSIINWKTQTIQNVTKLSMVVLKEVVDVPVDEFQNKDQIQYRVLDLYPKEGVAKPVYRVRIFEVKTENGITQDVLKGSYEPMIKGANLYDIPFQFVSVDDTSWELDEPPLIDLFDMNLSHYRTTADYEHGCHFTGLPTPVISGFTPENDGQKFYIGSMSAWVFPNAQAKASYLEFTGQGLGSLKSNMDKKEMHMAILGARMLEAQPKGVESADTAAIHRGGEQSMLSSVAQALSIGFTKALRVFCDFANATGECSMELNRDFFPIPMDALTLTAIIAAWQNSAISYESMFENLQAAEIVPLSATAETEQASIAANPPPLPDVGTTPGSPSPNAPKGKGTPATPAPTITQLQHPK